MPNMRQPVGLIQARGKKHLTKAEIAEREAAEVKAPTASARRMKYPAWLPNDLKRDFREVALQLIDLGIFSELDGDLLGRYLMAQESYLQASTHLSDALARGDSERVAEWSAVQDRFFKQATASARELGLTISSRCRLVIPQPPEAPEDPDDDLFA